MLFCFFSQNELYSTVRKIVENYYLPTEANASEIMMIQRMKEMANYILFKREQKIKL